MDKSEILHQLKINRTEPPPKSRWPWLGLVLLVLSGLGFYHFYQRPVAGIKVKTAIAQSAASSSNASLLDATGYVVARRQATVSAKITGKIAEVFIEEGQKVQEGQVLAQLDPTDAKAQLELTKAQLQAARSLLNDLHVQLAQSQREWKRQQDLVARRLTSVQAAEQALATEESLQARLASQQVQIQVAEKSLQLAQVNLENTIVKAPFAGVVVAKNAQPGEVVSPLSAGGFTRTGIGTLVDMDSLEIEVNVNEAYIGRVQAGQPVEARLNAYPDWAIPGKVIAIIPTADRNKATVKVRIGLDSKDSRIVPEMGVRVSFLADKAKASETLAGVMVPVSAIFQTESGPAVFVLANGAVKLRPVNIGQLQNGNRQILHGLQSGERVVLEPPPGLKESDKLELE